VFLCVLFHHHRQREQNVQGPADPARAEEMDFASFVASLTTPELRRDVLLSADAAMLARLPPALRTEANVLRGREARSEQRRRVAAPQRAQNIRSTYRGPSLERAIISKPSLAEMIRGEIKDLLLYHKADSAKDDIIRTMIHEEGERNNIVQSLARIMALSRDCCAPNMFQCAVNVMDRLCMPETTWLARRELAAVAEHIMSRLWHQLRQGAALDTKLVYFFRHNIFAKCSLLAVPTVDAPLQLLWGILSRRLLYNGGRNNRH